jgi:hypothetical protein
LFLQAIYEKGSWDFESTLSYYRKMVKSTIKSDMLVWLKSIDNNLKHQPKQFWNYVSKLRKDSDSPAQYQVDGAHVTTQGEIASAFCKHFQSVYGNTPSGVLKFPFSLCSDTLVVASVNDDDVCKATKRLRSTKFHKQVYFIFGTTHITHFRTKNTQNFKITSIYMYFNCTAPHEPKKLYICSIKLRNIST